MGLRDFLDCGINPSQTELTITHHPMVRNDVMKPSLPGISLTSWIQHIHLAEPSLKDNTADADRLLHALGCSIGLDMGRLTADWRLLRSLPGTLRETAYRVRVVLFHDTRNAFLVDVLNSEDPEPVWGVAVDLGTTRIVIRLIDLTSKTVCCETSFDNPQMTIGPDILSRVHHACTVDGGLEHLQRVVIEELNGAIEALCLAKGSDSSRVFLVSVSGNTTMSHLLLGLSPYYLIREPYIPVMNRFPVVSATDIGLKLRSTTLVYVFPNIGSYFGGDLVSGILYAGLHRQEEPVLMVDVGTNAEVVLGNASWMMACAGAAGPALEGGVSKMGMMAGPGAIDRVWIDSNTGAVLYHTIGDQPPKGICGSGIIDLAACLFQKGFIDIRGKFVASACGDRLREVDGMAAYCIVEGSKSATGEPLYLTQADLDSLIRSKAAMYTILETLTAAVGMRPEELKSVWIAGTFGMFIDPVSAITIGMIPDLPLERYRAIGNSSLEGATLVLIRPEAMSEIPRIQENITYMELNVNVDFMNRFSAAKFLPHTDPSRFPSVGIHRQGL